MNYNIAQIPDIPSESETQPPATIVQPLESIVNRSASVRETIETAKSVLVFPASFPKVAEALNAQGLKCNQSTLKGRWMSKYILPAIAGVEMPEIKTDKGITAFGFALIGEILKRCVVGESGQTIAPEVLREELIERYGAKPEDNILQSAKDLLAKTQQIKQDSDDQKALNALAKLEAKSQLDILEEAVRTLATVDDDEEEVYELSEAEKARLARRFLAKTVAEQEYLQKLAKGEV